jgi:hypothetical protein
VGGALPAFARDCDMEGEWQFHINARIDDLVESGMSRHEATLQARRDFGDPLPWKELGRRQFRRAPVFAVVTVTTLTLCVGANTALFSLINSLVIRALPGQAPDRPDRSDRRHPDVSVRAALSGYTYQIRQVLKARGTAFDGVAAWPPARVDLSSLGEAASVDGSSRSSCSRGVECRRDPCSVDTDLARITF